jgi:WD40 repeat protein
VDRYGDPLPPLAIARLGTVRWRQELRGGSRDVAISTDGRVVAALGDAGLFLWEVPTGKRVPWFPSGSRAEAAVFPPAGRTLVTVGREVPGPVDRDLRKAVYLIQHWELGTGRLLRQRPIEVSALARHHAVFSSDGRLLVVNAGGEQVRGWDTLSGKLVFDLGQGLNQFSPVGLSADGKTLAAVSGDSRLSLYDTATGKELRSFPVRSYGPTLSPDGKTLAASTATGLRVWDAAGGRLRGEFDSGLDVVAFSADAKYMAFEDRRVIRLLEVDSLREVRRFANYATHDSQRLQGLAFSADGRLLVSGQGLMVGLWGRGHRKAAQPPPGAPGGG